MISLFNSIMDKDPRIESIQTKVTRYDRVVIHFTFIVKVDNRLIKVKVSCSDEFLTTGYYAVKFILSDINIAIDNLKSM